VSINLVTVSKVFGVSADVKAPQILSSREKKPVVNLCCGFPKQPNLCLFNIKSRDLVDAVLDCMTQKAAQIEVRPSN
jgi:hypothetical protein